MCSIYLHFAKVTQEYTKNNWRVLLLGESSGYNFSRGWGQIHSRFFQMGWFVGVIPNLAMKGQQFK